jgi:translation initiation factor 2B subunit (eIF-2B alpha/beta/delta family)
MDTHKAATTWSSILAILKHIDSVQSDIIELSEQSVFAFQGFIEKEAKHADENVLKAYQYQDVIRQQLNAVKDAIGMIEQSIHSYVHALEHDEMLLEESIDTLSKKLHSSLQVAKDKQAEFSGNTFDEKHHQSLEFF